LRVEPIPTSAWVKLRAMMFQKTKPRTEVAAVLSEHQEVLDNITFEKYDV